jgi:hypothetical protein
LNIFVFITGIRSEDLVIAVVVDFFSGMCWFFTRNDLNLISGFNDNHQDDIVFNKMNRMPVQN